MPKINPDLVINRLRADLIRLGIVYKKDPYHKQVLKIQYEFDKLQSMLIGINPELLHSEQKDNSQE